jgi:glutathione peroxidase-family protein
LAFPTNDFHQELDSNAAIQSFVSEHFPQVTFPIFATSSLHDNVVYQTLQHQLPDEHVRHNFYKFLVDRNGVAVHMFSKQQDPLELEEHIEKLLLGPPLQKMVTQ